MWANALSLRRLVLWFNGFRILSDRKDFQMFLVFWHLIELRLQVSLEVENHIEIVQNNTKNREQREEEREREK